MIRRVAVPDGVVVFADHEPLAAARAPVLLLHGFTGDRTSFGVDGLDDAVHPEGRDGLVAALGPDRRVLVPDLPGHGETALGDAPCTLARSAEVLRAALGSLGVARAAVLGYSMGGRLALQLALAAPELVERLVLVSASAGLPTEEERRARREQDESLARFIESHPIADFVARWEALPLFATERSLPEAVRERRRRQRLRADPAGLAASLRGMGTGVQPWLGTRLGELRMPVLAVAGALDTKFAAIARRLAPEIPDGALAVVDGAGHAVHLERAGTFAELVREFLDED